MSDSIVDGPQDLVVVGAGPCGIAVGAAAREAGLRAVLFDRGAVTSSLLAYPYYMTFFSTKERLEITGVPFTIAEERPDRRQALAYYRRVVEHFDLDVRTYTEVVGLEGQEGDYTVHTRTDRGEEAVLSARAVVFATGGLHRPNSLGVPGEEPPRVRHVYREPYPYHDQDVLVVGGGNSAVEATLELYRNGARVSLVHFLEELDDGVKPWILPDIHNRIEKGEIPVHWGHRVAEIRPREVVLRREGDGEETVIENDFVLALTGWCPDSGLLEDAGVRVDPDDGVPAYDPGTMETNVPGIYVAGVLAAGDDPNDIFIENGREHGAVIVHHLLERDSAQAPHPGPSGRTSASGPSAPPTRTSPPGSTSRRT